MRTLQVITSFLFAALLCCAEELPTVTAVEFQPLAAQVARLTQALELIGEPLPAADNRQLKQLLDGPASAKAVLEVQRLLDKHCLVGIDINPTYVAAAQARLD